MASDKQNVRAACSKDKLFVIQNFFESCHKVGMFHKNDAVNQNVVDKVLCQRYTVEHK